MESNTSSSVSTAAVKMLEDIDVNSEDLEDLCIRALNIVDGRVKKMQPRVLLENFILNSIGGIPMILSGSRSECVHSKNSDSDFMYQSSGIKTINDPKHGQLSLSYMDRPYDAIVTMDTEGTHKGYTKVKLFSVQNHTPKLEVDADSLCEKDSPFLSNVLVAQFWKEQLSRGSHLPTHGLQEQYYRHGPCVSFKYAGLQIYHEIDTLFSLKCEWPTEAGEWLSRERKQGWPTKAMIEHIKAMGCHLVPKGHDNSPQRDIEWRISFNLAERELMWSCNAAQYACVDYMKLFFQHFISPKYPDLFPSYFIKTEFLWMAEETSPTLWQPKHFIECLDELLERIIVCVEKKEVRNYFIPSNNMMDIKPQQDLDLLLPELRRHQNTGPSKWIVLMKERSKETDKNDIYFYHVRFNSLCLMRHYTLNCLGITEKEHFKRRLDDIREKIERAIAYGGLFEDTCGLFIKELDTINKCCDILASKQNTEEARNEFASLSTLIEDNTMDFCTIKLTLATIQLYLDRYDDAREIVEDLIEGYDHRIVHYWFHSRDKTPKDVDYDIKVPRPSFCETLQRFIAFDMVCFPSLMTIYPKSIQTTMTESGSALFVHPLFYANVIRFHCLLQDRNAMNGVEDVIETLDNFVVRNEDLLKRMSDVTLHKLSKACQKLAAVNAQEHNTRLRKRKRTHSQTLT